MFIHRRIKILMDSGAIEPEFGIIQAIVNCLVDGLWCKNDLDIVRITT